MTVLNVVEIKRGDTCLVKKPHGTNKYVIFILIPYGRKC